MQSWTTALRMQPRWSASWTYWQKGMIFPQMSAQCAPFCWCAGPPCNLLHPIRLPQPPGRKKKSCAQRSGLTSAQCLTAEHLVRKLQTPPGAAGELPSPGLYWMALLDGSRLARPLGSSCIPLYFKQSGPSGPRPSFAA